MKQSKTYNLQPISYNRIPLVSVIMPVYNAGDFLWQALESIFCQSYKNIEVIAINDGSTDNSLDILQRFSKLEVRLKILNNEKNIGVSGVANIALKHAKGKFIARMDADDTILPDRIKKQVEFLLKHPDVVVVGGQVDLVSKSGTFIVHKNFPQHNDDIIKLAFTAMPIQQGAMMINRELLPENIIWYRYKYATSEDLDFFFRVFQFGKAANLPDTVLYYRQHGDSLTQVELPKEIFLQAYQIRKEAINKYKVNIDLYTRFLMLFQYILVLILPSSLIYPLYYIWRGLKPFRYPKVNILRFIEHTMSYIL